MNDYDEVTNHRLDPAFLVERNHGQGIPLRRYEHREWYEDAATVILWWIACAALGFVVGAMIGMLV